MGFGSSRSVRGTEHLYIPLESENKNLDLKSRDSTSSYNMYGSGGYRRTHSKNVLFINTTTDEMKWLFRGVRQIVTSIEQLPKWDSKNPQNSRYLIYAVIDTDTNGDGEVNRDDSSSLAFSEIDGSGYQVILNHYERIISEILLDGDILVVVYQKAGVGYAARYSLSPFKLITRTELPKVE